MVKGRGYQELLETRVLGFLREHHLVSGQHQLVVAVSGGQDSVCLLHILVKLQEELKIELHVAHLNHELRGADSEADAHYVAHLARQLGIPSTIERRDVKAYRVRQRTSLEEAARELRYSFLAEVARSIGASRVAVGHTGDDHIETILMHLIRGTGSRGLRGLRPSNHWQSAGNSVTVIRPLLPVRRPETADYCHRYQLMPRADASNLSLSPLRNRIRLQLLPLLQSYNPRVAEALLRTARIAGDDLAFLDKESARLWASVAQRQGNVIFWDKERFLGLPAALQRHLLRAAFAELLGSLKDIEARHMEEVMAALTRPAGRRLSLPGGLVFVNEYDQYLLSRDAAALSPFPVLSHEIVLKVPGETLLPGYQVAATIIGREQMSEKEDLFTACLDLDKVAGEVTVRCRRPGDRFQPLGMGQPKKLGEFMIDAKIPRAWRQRVPLVASSQHILWVVGWRLDDRVKVTENTGQVLCLEFKRR
ncbi:MAG: tRNA lysidine(34) synthetase TilS [Chloroflexi bacterium]|nr:tRNA lysidine(34) synthetase TilS [Chloroflexota bacterium]